MRNKLVHNPKGAGRKKGSDDLTISRRRDEVASMLREGIARGIVVNDMVAKYSISARQANYYIQDVLAEWAEQHNMTTLEDKVAYRTAQMETLLEKCIQEGDKVTALRVLDRLCKVEGLYEPIKVTMEHRVAQMSDIQQEDRLDYLIEKRKDYQEAQYEVVKELELVDDDDIMGESENEDS